MPATQFAVEVAYSGSIRPELDQRLSDLAKTLGGRCVGAGSALFCAQRDLEFHFARKTNAVQFAAAVKAFDSVRVSDVDEVHSE